MTDSSDRSFRQKPSRKKSSKKSASNAHLFPLVLSGFVLIVLIGTAATFGPIVRKKLSAPSAATILAAQEPFERQHQADRQQNPIIPVWRPLNPESRKFNVLLPMPCKCTTSNRYFGGGTINRESFHALVDYNDINSPLLEVSIVSHKVEKMPVLEYVRTLGDAQIRELMRADQVVSNRFTKWHDLDCREYELIRQGRRDLSKIIILGPEDYVVMSFLFAGPPPQEQIDRFFNSFSLEGDPVKYGSPAGWPDTSAEIVKKSNKMRSFQKAPREMDRSRWLKLSDEPVDVLAHVDVFRDANHGRWYRFDKGIVAPDEKGPMLVLPVEPPDSYEMLLEVRRLSSDVESFNIGLIVGGKPAFISIDGYGGDTTCLSPVDGKFGRDVAQFHDGRLLEGIANTIRVRVTPDSVQVDINERKNVIDFKGDPSRLGLNDFWHPPENALFLADWNTPYYITKCEMRKR